MEAPETPVGSVGELFTWGQKTGGSKQDLLAFRSSKVRGSGARARLPGCRGAEARAAKGGAAAAGAAA